MHCIKCSEALGPGIRICPRCGVRVAGTSPPPGIDITPLPSGPAGEPAVAIHVMPPPAGFWQRVGAFCIDAAIVSPTAYLAQLAILPVIGGVLTWWLYFSLFESSRWQATPGKRLVGIKVTDVNGVRIRFSYASLRFFAKTLSAATLGAGFAMVGLTRHKQGLHDMIANALILRAR